MVYQHHDTMNYRQGEHRAIEIFHIKQHFPLFGFPQIKKTLSNCGVRGVG